MQSFLRSSRHRLLLFSIIFFILYLASAICFYKERIFLDGSYYFFHVVNAQHFRVEHQRYILIASQLLAWIGANLHRPLHDVMLLNSINPVLYLMLLFFLSFYWLKHEGASWALLLIGVCGIYFIYFCPMYEVWYGAALLIFFTALLEKQMYQTIPQQIFFDFVLITVLFAYPLLFIGVIFFLCYHFFENKPLPRSIIIQWVVIFIVWILYKYFFISDYESGKISYPESQMGNIIKGNFGSLQNVFSLVKFLFSYYVEVMIMALLAVGILMRRKRFLLAGLMITAIIGYILLINFTQQTPWVRTNYFERMYLILIPLCTVPFMKEIFSSSRMKLFWELCFVAVILYRGIAIFLHADFYVQRTSQLNQFITKAQSSGGSKFYIDDAKHTEYERFYEWSLPMETILFSSLQNNQHTICISALSDLNAEGVKQKLNASNFHLRLDEICADDWLNQSYFHLQDGMYKELNP